MISNNFMFCFPDKIASQAFSFLDDFDDEDLQSKF